MKKLLVFSMMCLIALSMQAQRYAVLQFKSSAGISIADVDGISEMFGSCFRPSGYTEVDRSFYNQILEEQALQHSSTTEELAVSLGKIRNVSKVITGKVSPLGGQYNVEVRVLDVQTETTIAKEGASIRKGQYFREDVCALAKKVASMIAITPGATVHANTPAASTARSRNKVEVLYGYLKIFPNELGVFQAEPTSVIAQINKQAQHGYNNWRIPTNEELSLMRANNYLGSGEYMCRESKHGIVLLVTDGKDYATIKAEEQEKEQARIRAEQERKAAQERRAAELKAKGLVDLGLPSGTLWKDKNEEGGFYTYEQAKSKYGVKLPTKDQFEELKNKCQWSWNGSGYKVIGPNGNSIVLPASGYRWCDGHVDDVGSEGLYWSSTPDGSDEAWRLNFRSVGVYMYRSRRCSGLSVRLVQD